MPTSPSKLSRRTLFAGAGTVGALAAVASMLPTAQSMVPVADVPVKTQPERGGGYTLSAHVQQYYKTTRV